MSSLIGTGPSFPCNVSYSGGLKYVSDVEKIDQSLFILFNTRIGSRLYLPMYGSRLNNYRFDPLDQALLEKLRYTITEDIKLWEPRITLNSVEFLADENDIENHIIYISITYTVIHTNVSHNYVHPYKLEPYDATRANTY